jgi:hypothetical protein
MLLRSIWMQSIVTDNIMRGMLIDNEFELGETVYLKTDIEQLKRIVTKIGVQMGGLLTYQLCCGTEDGCHYECEISREQHAVLIGVS